MNAHDQLVYAFAFLMGLNDQHIMVRSQVLMMDLIS